MGFLRAPQTAMLVVACLCACTNGDGPPLNPHATQSAAASAQNGRPPSTRTITPASGSGAATTLSETPDDAACHEGKVLFHCRTTNDEQVLLCDNASTLAYSFGTPPELEIRVPRDQATTFQWQGVGRWISYSVTVPNKNASYTVFTSIDRLSDESRFEAGVIAAIDGAEVARILCTDPVKHALEGVDLRQGE